MIFVTGEQIGAFAFYLIVIVYADASIIYIYCALGLSSWGGGPSFLIRESEGCAPTIAGSHFSASPVKSNPGCERGEFNL